MSEPGNRPSSGDLAVCLTFDFDGPGAWVGDTRNPAEISRGEFAAVAVPRILKLLLQRSINATFFVPGHTAYAYPDHVRMIRDHGHEIAHHGWAHESAGEFDIDTQRRFFARGMEALDEVAGVQPVGYRAPNCSYTSETVDILLDNGMLYDSGYSASDFHPHYLRRGDSWSAEAEYSFGTTSDLVELPFAWHLDDWVNFEFLGGYATTMNTPSAVGEVWQAEFDYALAHEPGGVFVLTMHPEVIGRASRLMMLERLIDHMAAHSATRFETMADHAARWRQETPVQEWLASSSPLVPRPFRLAHEMTAATMAERTSTPVGDSHDVH